MEYVADKVEAAADDSKAAKKLSIDEVIQQINAKLANNEKIDFSDYPPLFVAHYRGTHYFTQFATQAERRQVRQRIAKGKFKDTLYSPAVYELAKLKLGEPIDTVDKKQRMRAACKLLKDRFEKLEKQSAEKSWYGSNQKKYSSSLFQHYQRYVNSYREFRAESAAARHACYKTLGVKSNPYVSTADNARHAVFYALGAKAELCDGTLRPGYTQAMFKDRVKKKLVDKMSVKPKHPKVGYVQVLLHPLSNFKRNKPLMLSSLQANDEIDIKTRQLNERETTFRGSISAKYIAYTKTVRFPSFNKPYQEFYKRKYGIDSAAAFSRYTNALVSGAGNTGLIDVIADHYGQQLEDIARRKAEAAGGYLVYLDLDGTLKKHLPATIEITTRRNKANKKSYMDHYPATDSCSDSEDDTDEIDELTDKVAKSHIEKPDMEAWYTDNQLSVLFNFYAAQHQNIHALAPMLGADNNQIADLAVHMAAFHRRRLHVFAGRFNDAMHSRAIIPVNLYRNHWALLCVEYQPRSNVANNVYFMDPLGNPMPQALVGMLHAANLFPGVPITCVRRRVQRDGHNCGPWVVELARRYLQSGLEGLNTAREVGDIDEARAEHFAVLAENAAERLNAADSAASALATKAMRR